MADDLNSRFDDLFGNGGDDRDRFNELFGKKPDPVPLNSGLTSPLRQQPSEIGDSLGLRDTPSPFSGIDTFEELRSRPAPSEQEIRWGEKKRKREEELEAADIEAQKDEERRSNISAAPQVQAVNELVTGLSHGWDSAMAFMEAARTDFWERRGDATPEEIEEAERLRGVAEREAQLAPEGGFGWFGASVGQIAGSLWSSGKEALKSAGVGAAVGGSSGGVAGALAGGSVGLTGGFLADSFIVNSGSIAGELSRFRGPNAETIEDHDVDFYSTLGGGVMAALDAASFKILAKPFEAAMRKTMAKEVADSIARRVTGSTGKRMAIEYAKGIGAETITETTQEVVQVVAQDLAKQERSGDLATIFNDPAQRQALIDRSVETALTTAAGMSVIAAPGAIVSGRKPDVPLTPEDRASPIPDDVIQQGRNDLADAAEEAGTPDIAVQRPGKSRAETSGTTVENPVSERLIFEGKVAGVESGGNDNAKNPRSSASGRYQFTDSTWEALGGDLTNKNDPAEQERLFKKLTDQNEAALERNGIPVTAGNLYLSHFAGQGGANALHKADPNTPVEQVLGQKVVDANPFLKGMKAADVIRWAANKMGGVPEGAFFIGAGGGSNVAGEAEGMIEYPSGDYAVTREDEEEVTDFKVGEEVTVEVAGNKETGTVEEIYGEGDQRGVRIRNKDGTTFDEVISRARQYGAKFTRPAAPEAVKPVEREKVEVPAKGETEADLFEEFGASSDSVEFLLKRREMAKANGFQVDPGQWSAEAEQYRKQEMTRPGNASLKDKTASGTGQTLAGFDAYIAGKPMTNRAPNEWQLGWGAAKWHTESPNGILYKGEMKPNEADGVSVTQESEPVTSPNIVKSEPVGDTSQSAVLRAIKEGRGGALFLGARGWATRNGYAEQEGRTGFKLTPEGEAALAEREERTGRAEADREREQSSKTDATELEDSSQTELVDMPGLAKRDKLRLMVKKLKDGQYEATFEGEIGGELGGDLGHGRGKTRRGAILNANRHFQRQLREESFGSLTPETKLKTAKKMREWVQNQAAETKPVVEVSPSGAQVNVYNLDDNEKAALAKEVGKGAPRNDGAITYPSKDAGKIREILRNIEADEREARYGENSDDVRPGRPDEEPEAKTGTAETLPPTKVSEEEFKAVWNSKAFKEIMKALGDLPHRESPVAAEMVRGWIDGRKDNLDQLRAEVAKSLTVALGVQGDGSNVWNPRQSYLEGYYASEFEEAKEVRAKGGFRDVLGPEQVLAAITQATEPEAPESITQSEAPAPSPPRAAPQTPSIATRTPTTKDSVKLRDWSGVIIPDYSEQGLRGDYDGGPTKDAFLKDAKSYAKAVESILTELGFSPPPPRPSRGKPKPRQAVHVSQGGPAVSGDVYLEMRRDDGSGVLMQIGTALAGPNGGISIMARSQFNGGQDGTNRWLDVTMDAGTMARMLEQIANERARAAPPAAPAANPEPTTNQKAAFERGKAAFAAGASRVPPGSETLRAAWLNGWDRANLDEPMGPGLDQFGQPVAEPAAQPTAYGSNNKLVTADRAAEIRAKLRDKLRNQISSGIDPEILALGTELAVFHIEAGARSFAQFVKAVADDMGMRAAQLKPFLRAWYLGAQMMIEDSGGDIDGMDGPGAVRAAISMIEDEPSTATPVGGISETGEANADATRETSPEGTDRTGDAGTRAEDVSGIEGQGGIAEGAERSGGSGLDAVRDGGEPSERGGAVSEPQPDASGIGERDGAGAERGRSGRTRASRRVRGKPADRGANFLAGDGSLKRTGSWRDTAERNLDIIELVNRIAEEGRPATPEEQAELARFTGWGASEIRNKLFKDVDRKAQRIMAPQSWNDWKDTIERARNLLHGADLETALQSTQYAHYTSEGIVRSIWDALRHMGFGGGRILEPGMGIGHFFTAAPADMMENSRYTGIELDGFTARVASLLLPQENVIHGDFTRQAFPDGFFDAAIGNPPFANIKVQTDPAYKKQRFSLHDYFFAKSLDKVRSGGLVAFVTSRYTMDKLDVKARQFIADRADLVGAIRLPQTAFKENAGTEVVTDVLFLQKRAPGAAPGGQSWLSTKEVSAGGQKIAINEYFADHPEMVLGKHATTGSMYSKSEYTVEPYASKGSIEKQFADAAKNLPAHVYTEQPHQNAESLTAKTYERDFAPASSKEGGLYVKDGKVLMVDKGSGVPVETIHEKLKPGDMAWLKDYVDLRDLLKVAQKDQLQDGDWEKSHAALVKAYRAFVKKHGRIKQFTTYERMDEDADGNKIARVYRRFKYDKLLVDLEAPLVQSLERITDAGEIVDGPFLGGRTINKPTRPQIETTADALAVNLDEIGRLDIDYIAGLIGKTHDEVIEELGELVYRTPGGEWQTADEYLSGDVVRKLEEAEAAAVSDPDMERNVTALRAAQPPLLSYENINVRLGAPWIRPQTVTQFADEVLGQRGVPIAYEPANANWTVSGAQDRWRRDLTSDFGTPERSPLELLDAVLNNRSIKVTDTYYEDGKKKEVTSPEKTAAANEAAKKIIERFRTWLWEDTGRVTFYTDFYNRHYNNLAPRKFDGSHLTTPGLSAHYTLYPHQKRAIARVIQTGNTYLNHAVGAGKTLEMIVSGMEMRRLGLIKKPMYIVPNHMLNQFAQEFLEAYPAANIMVADEQQFHTGNRQRFLAQASLNDPDAIILTHSSFGKIDTSTSMRKDVLDALISDLEDALQQAKDEGTARHTVSKIEKQIEQLKQRFEGRTGTGKDKLLTFDEMGVDFLFVDEAHEFRKLDFATNRTAKGIDSKGSARALDLFIKARWLHGQNPGRSLVLASGTPVTNTMAELYTVMRLLALDEMEKDNIAAFDAWANMFGEVVAGYEQNAAGGYEIVERFAKFVNVPELMKRVRTFMDVLSSEQLGDLVKRPKVKGGIPTQDIAPASPELEAYMKGELNTRLETSRKWKPSKDQPGNPDPVINIITDARLASIDMRFVSAGRKSDPDSKLNRMIKRIAEVHQSTKGNEYLDRAGGKAPRKGAAQIVFSAVGFGEQVATNRGFDIRAWIESELVRLRVPKSEIAWMSDANTHAKKEQLQKDVRSGKVRVLFGSPKNMGTGLNVQDRLYALHYLSPPWYPADVEQPHGRIIRQGNQHTEVDVVWYATKGTYDSTQWGMVSRKQKFIEQAMVGDDSVRVLEDISEANQYEMAAALAAGDDRLIRVASLSGEITRLENLQTAHYSKQQQLRSQVKWLGEREIPNLKRQVEDLSAAAKLVGYAPFSLSANGATHDKHGEGGKALKAAMQNVVDNNIAIPRTEVGRYRGHALFFAPAERGHGLTLEMEVGPLRMQIGDRFEKVEDLDDTGIARRIEGEFQRIPQHLRERQRELEQAETEFRVSEPKVGAPFAEAGQLAEAIAERAQLQAEIAADSAPPPAPQGSVIESPDQAGWTDERITQLLRQYAVSHAPTKTKSYVTWINPQQFVDVTTPTEAQGVLNEEAGDLDVARLRGETQTPFLIVDQDASVMSVVGHEGRHRMAALAKAGVTRVPFVLNVRGIGWSDLQPKSSAVLLAQRHASDYRGAKNIILDDLLPLSYENEDAIREQYGQGALRYQRGDAADLPGYLRRYDDKLRAELEQRMKVFGLSHRVALNFSNDPLAEGNWQGQYWRRVISIASNVARDPMRVLSHEATHAYKALGLFTPTEWKLLTDKAWKEDRLRTWAQKHYSQLSEELQREEAAAEYLAESVLDLDQVEQKWLGRMVKRLVDFIAEVVGAIYKVTGDERLANVDVYKLINRIRSGEFGKRPTGFGEPARDRPGLVYDGFRPGKDFGRRSSAAEPLTVKHREGKLPHADTPEQKYIRFGDLPQSGRSTVGRAPNFSYMGEVGSELGGISVFPVTYNAERNLWEFNSDELAESGFASLDELIADQDETAERFVSGGHEYEKVVREIPGYGKVTEQGKYLGWSPPVYEQVTRTGQRPIYLVTGEEVDEGTDGEPLLANVQILDKLNVQDVLHDGYFDPDEDLSPKRNPSAFGLDAPRFSVADPTGETFYSALQRAVESVATVRASASQWLATIRRAPGVKREELEWSGVEDWLAMQEGPVEKSVLLDVLRNNAIVLDERILGAGPPQDLIDGMSESKLNDAVRNFEEQYERKNGEFPDDETVQQFINDNAGLIRDAYEKDLGEDYKTRFEAYSSDDSNPTYREMLITLPLGEGGNPDRAPSTHWDQEAVVAHTRFMDKEAADGSAILFIEEIQSDWHQKGREQGYEVATKPAEVERLQEASRLAGRAAAEARINFWRKLEEIRKKLLAQGLIREKSLVPFGAAVPPLLDDQGFSLHTVHETDRMASSMYLGAFGGTDLSSVEREMIEARDLYDARNEAVLRDTEAYQALVNSRSGTGIPNAPFKTSWPALVMKRLIRYAAENGYQRIAWTTGDEQAERYRLDFLADGVNYQKNDDGETYGLSVVATGRAPRMIETAADEVQLREILGNELAEKVLRGEGNPIRRVEQHTDNPVWMQLSAEDLRVGGEGMRAFYDRNLVNITNDIIKKYGAKVGQIELPGVNPARAPDTPEIETARAARLDVEGEELVRATDVLREAVDASRRASGMDNHPGFEMTDALRSAAMGGFPMFSVATPPTAATPDFGPGIEDRFQAAKSGVGQANIIDKASEWWHDLTGGMTRHWRYLPNQPRFADVQQQLRKLEAAPDAAMEESIRHLRKLVGGLNAKEYDLLTRKIILDDLTWDAGEGRELPFGFTPSTLMAARRQVDAMVNLNPKLVRAVRERKDHNHAVAEEMVATGVLTRDQVKNPAYFRHMVLEYARAEAKLARTPGRVKSPYWAKRMGSEKDINANLLEAELDWLMKARVDIALANAIDFIDKSPLNIRAALRRQAKDANRTNYEAALASNPDARKQDGWFRSNIARGFKIVADELEAGNITGIPAHFQAAADALMGAGPDEPPFAFLAWILDNSKPGAMGAGMVLKYSGQRREFMSRLLGDDYLDPDDIAGLVKALKPEGYVAWQPKEGRHLFTAKTITEHAVDMFVSRLADTAAPGLDRAELAAALGGIRRKLVVGGERYTIAIPEELAATLDEFGDRRAEGMVASFFGGIQSAWKRWVLINPRRFFKYNLNNMTGDLDAIIAGNPGALLKVAEAWRVLRRASNGDVDQRYRDAQERGVFTSGLSAQEIPDINRFSDFRHLTEKKSLRPDKLLVGALAKVWRGLQDVTNFREALFRLAAYIDYIEKIEKGIPQSKIGYGASVPNMVNAVSDPKDRAALLARDLVGDYGAISVAGGWLRRYLVPFWSWLEINTKRYWRLHSNVYRTAKERGLAAGGIKGAALAGTTAAHLYIRMATVYGLLYMWNNMLFSDEEDDLSEDQRRQLHLILGRDADGQVITLRTQGALSDVLGFFGFQDFMAGMEKWEDGQGTIGSALLEMAKAPVNRVLTSVTPLISVPIEQVQGKEFWPDMFNPRQIHDRWRHLFSTFSMEHEYDALADKPSRGYTRSWTESVVYRRDPDEIAYDESKGIAYDWLERVKGQEGGNFRSERGEALREYRLALKYGDQDAADKALVRYAELGGTERGLSQSIARQHPLGPIAKKDRQAFLDSLTDEQLEIFADAEEFWLRTYAQSE